MVIKKTETQKIEVLADIICNKCLNSCMRKIDVDTRPPGDFYGTTIAYSPGYMSTAFSDDNSTHRIDICENCIAELFASCKTGPDVY